MTGTANPPSPEEMALMRFYDQQEILLLYGRNDPRLTPEFLAEWDQTPTTLGRYMNNDWD